MARDQATVDASADAPRADAARDDESPDARRRDAEIAAVLGAGGVLERALPGFRPREQQIAMAQAIARAIAARAALVVEAGTGTGKTFAYLVPALLFGGKVIVSTGTKTLQDQLFERDLPLVRDALAAPVTTALLKGRANYVCHYHLERAVRENRLPSRDDARHLAKIVAFARIAERGDRAELADVPEHAAIWPLVTSTRDNCLGQNCPHHADCFVLKARREALEADVVVVNHHLFFADVMLRDEGVAELLPNCNTVILDEAHQLPETATLFFGDEVTAGALGDLARDAEITARTAVRDVAALPEIAADVVPALRKLRLAAGETIGRFARDAVLARPDFAGAIDDLATRLERLASALDQFAERGEEIAVLAARARDVQRRVARWRDATDAVHAADDDEGEWIRWIDVTPHGFALAASPLSVAPLMRRHVEGSARTWIFTSATLAVGGDFSHYTAQLGLEAATTQAWTSPFDYGTQALLYVPRALPAPNSSEHTDAVVDAAVPLITASAGHAFLLFTTLRALSRARERLAAALTGCGLDYPLLVQGEGSRSELLARFRTLPNAVLLGSASFWEGVDVPGDALSLVVIDKLPFAPPDDPLLAARLARMREQGGNPFMDWQLPQAVISLKQGAGRLIRSETDRGVLAICDPRLIDKPYGRRVWQALPPMARTRDAAVAVAFLEGMRGVVRERG
ncbi:MAG: ATP-dependent DNA helicase [Burkholderiales bacterium]|nr:ATP-dependent DNA helicase [Burkholderiales bacterium]